MVISIYGFVQVNAMEICNLMGYGCKEGEASEEQIREVAAKAPRSCKCIEEHVGHVQVCKRQMRKDHQ